MKKIINDTVKTDFKELLIKFDYTKIDEVLEPFYYNYENKNEINEKTIAETKNYQNEQKKIDEISSPITKLNKSLVKMTSPSSMTSMASVESNLSTMTISQDFICYPSAKQIFRCFNYFNINEMKYVIIGQDPYHNGQANGLAFSISEDEKQPASLRVINKEYNRSLNVDVKLTDLTFLAEKKVLLLNTALTVEKGKPGSHSKLWDKFTQFIISEIDNENITFFLWGTNAKKYKKFINKSKVMESGHPSPLNRKNDFIGNNHFLEIK